MSFFGVLANTVLVLVGGGVGLLLKRWIGPKLGDAVMMGIGLCSIYIGIDGALVGENILIAVGAMILGAIIGTALNLDGAVNRLGDWAARKIGRGQQNNIAEGFVSCSLLFCVGAMTVNGAINAGISGDDTLFLTKSLMDMASAAMLATTMGAGCLLAAGSVLVVQGGLVLLSQLIAPFLAAFPSALSEMSCVGSLLIMAVGLNLLKVTRIKTANYLPAILIAPVLSCLATLIRG